APLEIASAPVSAVHPEAKARRTRNQVSAVVAGAGTEASGGTSPRARRRNPAPTRTRKVAMKRKVGTAKIRPDSRTPRGLARAVSPIQTTATVSRSARRLGSAEVTAATPAA